MVTNFPHRQMHNFSRRCSFFVAPVYVKRTDGSVSSVQSTISVDQLFSEQHNLKNGHVRFDSDVYQDPLLGQRVFLQSNEPSSTADMSDDEIAATVIPKGIQTLAETSLLRDLRPQLPVEDVLEHAVTESSTPGSSSSSE